MDGRTKRDLEIDLRASHRCVSKRVMPQRMHLISTPHNNDYLKHTMWFFLIFGSEILPLHCSRDIIVVKPTPVGYLLVLNRVRNDLSASSLKLRPESAQNGRVLENNAKTFNPLATRLVHVFRFQ